MRRIVEDLGKLVRGQQMTAVPGWGGALTVDAHRARRSGRAGEKKDEPIAVIHVESLKQAGITVELNPIEPDQYYGAIFEGGNELMLSGWAGGWDLSQVDDKASNAKVGAALVEPDRKVQAAMWQELNREAAKSARIRRSRVRLSGVVPELLKREALEFGYQFV